MAVTLVLLWLFLYDYADSKELPKEMSMKTDVGEVVLTTEECIFIKMGLKNYPYAAYATEKVKLTMKDVGVKMMSMVCHLS